MLSQMVRFDITCDAENVPIKPGSHRKILDYRPRTGKDQEILSESG